MARYELGVTTPAAAAGAAYLDIRTGANDRVSILEFGMFTTAATATSFGLIRPATIGTASTSQAAVSGDAATPNATSATVIGTAWSAAATISGTPAYLRRMTAAGNIGSGAIFTWPLYGLTVPVSSSLLVWNFGAAAGAACSAYVVFEEIR